MKPSQFILCLLVISTVFSTRLAAQEFREYFNDVVTVNSRTHWSMVNRKIVPLKIPSGAKGFFLSVDVNKRNTPRRAVRNALIDQLWSKKRGGAFIGAGMKAYTEHDQVRFEDINIYLLSGESNRDKFLERMNYDFFYIEKWLDVGDGSRYVSADGPQTLYLGLHNTNISVGLEVGLQIVFLY